MELSDKIYEKLSDPMWRMEHLYVIKNPEISTDPIPFVLRDEQRYYLQNEHSKNYVAKARQLGLSTVIVLKWLDEVLFNPNTTVATIDQREADCSKKLDMAVFAWENGVRHENPIIAQIWQGIHERIKLVRQNQSEIVFSNGSRYSASMTFVGQTLRRLHVSEFAIVSEEDISRAYRIVQGSFPAVPKNGVITIETTMRSPQGPAYEIFKAALDSAGKELNELNFKFFFFPWYKKKEYSLQIKSEALLTPETNNYFKELKEKHDISVTLEQKYWWQETRKIQKRFMFREYPSVPSECVMVQSVGQIYPEITDLRSRGRVRDFGIDKSYPVYVSADLGFSDKTGLWLIQFSHRDILLHRAYMKSGHGASGTADQIRKWEAELGISVAKILLPHDGVKTGTASGTSYVYELNKAGISNNRIIIVPRTNDVWTGINTIRDNINRFYVHSSCDVKNIDSMGNELPSCLECLELYRTNPSIPDKPYHDKIGISDVCDALRTFFEAYEKRIVTEKDYNQEKIHNMRRSTSQKGDFVLI